MFLTWTLSLPMWNSDALILTFPIAYMLFTELSAAGPPVAAMYCWMIYFAVDASYRKAKT